MPIEIQCQNCQRKLKVADKFAGKKAKCPNCQGMIDIPGTPVADAPGAAPAPTAGPAPRSASKSAAGIRAPQGGKDEWYLQTEDGEQYGPVSKVELDSWKEEGRVDASCQLLRDGWEQWKWAEEVYADLRAATEPSPPSAAPEIAPVNPFSSPVTPTIEPSRPERLVEPGGGVRHRSYPALNIASTIYAILAWIVAGFGALGLLIYLGLTLFGLANGMPASAFLLSLLMIAYVLFVTFLGWLTLKVTAEFLKLAMNVERDGHETAHHIRELVHVMTKRAP